MEVDEAAWYELDELLPDLEDTQQVLSANLMRLVCLSGTHTVCQALDVLGQIGEVIDSNGRLPTGALLTRLVDHICDCAANPTPRIGSRCINFLCELVKQFGSQIAAEVERVLEMTVKSLGRGGTVRTAAVALLVALPLSPCAFALRCPVLIQPIPLVGGVGKLGRPGSKTCVGGSTNPYCPLHLLCDVWN